MTIVNNINDMDPGTDGTAPGVSHTSPNALVLTVTPCLLESRERERVPGYQGTNSKQYGRLGLGPHGESQSHRGTAWARLFRPLPRVERRRSWPLLSVRQRDRDESRRPSVRNPELVGVGAFWRAL